MKVVFNSSPLIFLARLDFLEIFVESLDDFYLPAFVNNEINAKLDEASAYIQHLIELKKIQVRAINLISLANSLNVRGA